MTKVPAVRRLTCGVPNLDALCDGGIPLGSLIVVAGPPGSGKTILAQQIGFHLATQGQQILYFQTLSEPTAKTLLHLRNFSYFDPAQFESHVKFVDLGIVLRSSGLAQASELLMEHVRRVSPAVVVVDSFKVFDDLAGSAEEQRKFGYELAVNLMAWECTSLLLGEYAPRDYETNPLFSVADGIITMTQREGSGENQRYLQILKLRGTAHSRDPQPFVITSRGIDIFAPRLTMRRDPAADVHSPAPPRCKTGLAHLDELLGEGIPRGSSLLISGAAGTGKTLLLLEFIYRGAELFGERGILFSFEETEERLLATARGFGWDLEKHIASGAIQIVFIPQPEITVSQHLAMIQERVAALGARRVAIDSVSVFLHKTTDPQVAREKIFQMASIVQNSGAVGFFANDIPFGATQISRFGVEETVVDGVVLLTSREEGLDRQRYLEVYKLRNTAHLKGRHSMSIGAGGMRVFPRSGDEQRPLPPPPPIDTSRRLSTGIPRLDELVGGGLLERSVTLISGSTGIGKSTLGTHFVLAGAEEGEPSLYVALEEGPAQILNAADALGLSLRKAVDAGSVELLYLSRPSICTAQLVSVLTEAIRARGVRRLVLDGAGQIEGAGLNALETRQLLHDLVVGFKTLGVTSLLTLESRSLFGLDNVHDLGMSPIADNVVVLRYASHGPEILHTLGVVKTRGSAHDGGRYVFRLGSGGIHIGERVAYDHGGVMGGGSGFVEERPL